MTANNISAIYPLSPLQVGMLFQNIAAPESGAYVAQFVCTLRGDLDRAALRRAWEQVVERHDILRTAFVWEDVDEPLQVVGARVTLPWEEHDWRGVGADEQRERLEELLNEDRRRGYDPSRAPLMRLSLVATGEGESAFVWSHHHLLLDGWSTALLMKEVSDLYQALCRGERPRLPPPHPFREYVAWLRRQDSAAPEAFWRKTLEGVSAPTPLGVDRNAFAPPGGEKSYGQREDRLSEELTAALQAAARRHRLTLNTLVQGAWGLLLGRYSGTDDVVFGAVVSGRPAELPGVERMVGMFINTLAVRARLPQDEGLLPWLQNLQAEQAEARRYEHSSLTEVQGWAGLPRGQAMFESVMVFANYPVDPAGAGAESRLEVRDARLIERTDVPLTIEAAPGPELRLRVMYDEERFDGETAARLLRHLKTVLAGMAGGLEQRLADVPVLTDEERAELLAEPDAPPAHGYEHLLQELFEARAAADPSAAAVSFEGEVISYAELNARSNQLAHGLRDSGLAAGRPVAVMLGGGPPHVTALLGVLKAGSPFVCLDPQYPSARLEQIMEDVGADCLVTDAASLKPHAPLAARWQSERGVTVVGLDERGGEAGADKVVAGARWFETYPETNPERAAAPSDLAYVAFTSGSTGRPKGIMQPHRSFSQFLHWQGEYFRIGPGARVGQWAALTYDASYSEIFGALCFGATLCMTTAERRYDPAAFVGWLREERITHLQTVPSFCRQVLEALDARHKGEGDPWPELEHLWLAGEALSVGLARAWLGRLPRKNRLYNLYGPSEMVLATHYPVAEVPEGQRSIPIGRALAGRQILILDERQRLCPAGVVGEVYVRSRFLTGGYWQRPEETARVFIQNPLHGDYPDPVYRTGDLGRRLPDGNLEFKGRKDQQVKVRGMRVEIEEIEAALRRDELVAEAAVAGHEFDAGDLRLVAYVVLKRERAARPRADDGDATNGSAPEHESRLRGFLKESLPEHMVPSVFVFVAVLPRTSTGKLDRKALPKPDEVQRQVARPFVAPRTPLESLIAGIWQELLKVDRVGADDNFFELGGHSILATRAVNRLREKCLVELPLRSFLESPTVSGLAGRVEAAQRESEDGQRMQKLLDSVKQLSAEEASALLRSKRERI